MSAIRRGLRRWTAAWLVYQAASLSVFVPRACCAVHRPVAAPTSCHETATAPHCPMRAAGEAPCPMHRTSSPDQRPDDTCSMRGTCGGPMAAMFASLFNHGVLTSAVETSPVRGVARTIREIADNPINRRPAVDPPPPRI